VSAQITEPRARAPAGHDTVELLLGPGTHFEGLITFQGEARLEGAVEGEISGHGLLVLGAGATAKARIDVDELVVAGEIDGDVRARKRVELLASGCIRGDVETPRLVIAEGGRLLGRCTTGPAARSAERREATVIPRAAARRSP
jgi:cytoskeletal protein CcmA (bactofilin family)